MTLVFALVTALLWLVLCPGDLLAWGPGTHVALGEAVLSSLSLLPPAVQLLLQRFRVQFLYGSVAADISFAKKYAPTGRHCHHWHVGEEILESADSDALRAVAYGYLAHLAADTIAHNFFVPRQLLLTSTTQSVGHTYWEHRMDVHTGEAHLGSARRVVMEHDHSDADRLFDAVLSRTIFSFRTNRRIFRRMINFQGDDRWLQVFDRILRNSRFDLPDERVREYLVLSFDYVVEYLTERHNSRAYLLDPIGEVNLRLAKKVRRRGMANGAAGDPSVLDEMAEDFFPLPKGSLLFWPEIRGREGDAILLPPGMRTS